MSATGSLVNTDRAYNDTLSTQSQLGIVDNKTQPFVTPFSYRPSDSKSGGIEYAISDRFGIGISALQFSLNAFGQNRYPHYTNEGTTNNPNYVRRKDQTSYSIPGRYLMYNGTNMMALFSYHFIPKFVLDPYIHMKAGGGTFSTSSHRDTFDDDKYFLKTGNFTGFSKIVGVGAGVNIYILEEFGFKVEVEHYRQFLASANFSNQTLNSNHIHVGFVFDLTKLQK